jgi:hypothetical protein
MTNLRVVPDDPFGEQETTDLNDAWWRNFYMVEKWKGSSPVALIYGGNRLGKAQAAFAAVVKKRPRARYTLRQKARVLQKWPDE